MCKTFLNTFKIKSPVTMSVAATRIALSLFYTMCANNWRVELNRKSKCMIKYRTILPQNVPQYPNLSSSNSPVHHLRFFSWGDTVAKTKPKFRNTRVQINPSNSFIYHQQQMKERKEEKTTKNDLISIYPSPCHLTKHPKCIIACDLLSILHQD